VILSRKGTIISGNGKGGRLAGIAARSGQQMGELGEVAPRVRPAGCEIANDIRQKWKKIGGFNPAGMKERNIWAERRAIRLPWNTKKTIMGAMMRPKIILTVLVYVEKRICMGLSICIQQR